MFCRCDVIHGDLLCPLPCDRGAGEGLFNTAAGEQDASTLTWPAATFETVI